MNLNELKKKLQPKLHTFDIEDTTIYIHRPTGRDFEHCTDIKNTLILCVKDENGDPIFSGEDIDGRINVNAIDFVMQNEIYAAIIALVSNSNTVDEIEKK